MSLPLVDLGAADAPGLLHALGTHGAVLVRDPATPPARFAEVLDGAAELFALPDAELTAMYIEGSPHFRGYSVMHNERDWREQAHFGRDLPAVEGPGPAWHRLRGPNRWPPSTAWRELMSGWFERTERVGRSVLDAVAAALDVDAAPWLGGEPYLVAKLIAYHPQSDADRRRPGVAAHVDFSLITLTLQDEVGGLQVQRPGGSWVDVSPVPGTWLVHVGELLAYVTGGRVAATPHRVVNPSTDRTRYSLPLFVCPALDATIRPSFPPVPDAAPTSAASGSDHVHAVLDPAALPPSIAFGPAEWRRKGEDVWCRECCDG